MTILIFLLVAALFVLTVNKTIVLRCFEGAILCAFVCTFIRGILISLSIISCTDMQKLVMAIFTAIVGIGAIAYVLPMPEKSKRHSH